MIMIEYSFYNYPKLYSIKKKNFSKLTKFCYYFERKNKIIT